jgi:spore coat protein H
MSQVLKYLLQHCIFLSVFCLEAYNQPINKDHSILDLTDKGRKIENNINLYISDSEYESLTSTSGEKVNIRAKYIVINGDTLEPREISTRGQSTLMFRRKSLTFKLNSKASFRNGNRSESLKEFYVLNLAMDKYYCRNLLAFKMMEEVGIFDLFYSLCELRVNDRSEGIFMIIEQPEEWAIRKENSPLVIRRGYDHSIDKTKADRKTERNDTKKYLGYYRQIYKSLNKFQGEELFTTLSQWIDMDFYMKWVAFNFLVHNGDYADEVFFYIDPEIKKYRIIPWDYDDIFAVAPHEGGEQSKKVIGDKLLFSTEDMLDKKIATDKYLYEVYLKGLKEVLNKLPSAFLKQVIEDSYAELYPFYMKNEIVSNSQYDYYKDANPENLMNYMLAIYMGLRASHDTYLEYLKNRNN